MRDLNVVVSAAPAIAMALVGVSAVRPRGSGCEEDFGAIPVRDSRPLLLLLASLGRQPHLHKS